MAAAALLLAGFARAGFVRARASALLSARLGLDVTIDRTGLSLLPRPRLWASGVVFREPHHTDRPPLVAVDRLTVDAGPVSLLTQHFGLVRVDGLRIAVPPIGSGGTFGGSAPPGRTPLRIDHVRVREACLEFTAARADQDPLVFVIHALEVDDLGPGQAMPFRASLVNPVPKGELTMTGSVGPIRLDDPPRTPLSGRYELTHADLASVNGLGGTVASTGAFHGVLAEIDVEGQADVPDFSLELGGRAVPLAATFDATVDATTGTTRLSRVQGSRLDTAVNASGAVISLPGVDGYSVRFEVEVPQGRIEDVLSLAIHSPQPLLLGDVSLRGSMALPYGDTPVASRLRLEGQFGVEAETLRVQALAEGLQTHSDRAQGHQAQRETAEPDRVLRNVSGRFVLDRGVTTLHDISFTMPGALMKLDGTYTLASTALDFSGSIRVDASVSQLVGGFKSVFLKPFDFMFRRGNAGSVLSVRLTGTPADPRFVIHGPRLIGG